MSRICHAVLSQMLFENQWNTSAVVADAPEPSPYKNPQITNPVSCSPTFAESSLLICYFCLFSPWSSPELFLGEFCWHETLVQLYGNFCTVLNAFLRERHKHGACPFSWPFPGFPQLQANLVHSSYCSISIFFQECNWHLIWTCTLP